MGSLNGVRVKPIWQPVKWKVEYEMIVMLHLGGKNNKEISGIVGKHEVVVGLILRSDCAQLKIKEAIKKVPIGDLMDRYDRMLNIAVGRMEEYLNRDDLAQSTPGQMFDRASRVAEMIDSRLKRVEEKNNTTNNNTVVFASEENVSKLIDALDKTKVVTELHRKPMLKVVND